MKDIIFSVISWGMNYIKDPLRRNALFIIIKNILLSVLGFFFWMVAARFFSTKDIGLATAIISASNLLSTLALLGLNIGIIRFLSEEKDKSDMINVCTVIVGVFSIVLAVIFIGGIQIWSPALIIIRENFIYAFVFIVLVAAYSLFWMQYHIFIALRSAEYTLAQSSITALRIVCLFFMTSVGSLGIVTSFASGFVAAVLVAVILIKKIIPVYHFVIRESKRIIRNMLRFSAGNYLADTFKMLPGRILPIMVVNILSPETNAYFYIAIMIATILFTIAYSMGYSLLAEDSVKSEGLQRQVKKAIVFNFIVLIPAVLLVWLFGEEVLSLFGSGYAEESSIVLLLLAIASIPSGINELYVTVYRTELKVMPVILIRLLIASLIIIAGYFLMTTVGLIGIGYGWLATELIVMFCLTPFMFNKLIKGTTS